nr:3-hydroxyacyl-CoA dehydrogenase family protein [Tanacetum cinerariifolium]
MKVIAVIGAGQMGAGIAQLAAVAGADVWILDQDAKALQNAKMSIYDSVQRFVSKGQLDKVNPSSSY